MSMSFSMSMSIDNYLAYLEIVIYSFIYFIFLCIVRLILRIMRYIYDFFMKKT